MYAIVEIAGQQFRVERGKKLYVHRLDATEGAKVEFNKVLLTGDGDKVQLGTPSIDGTTVAATVIGHVKGDKVIVFKKKRRKGFQKSNGHRQQFTQILIQGILGKGETLKDEISYTKRVSRVEEPKDEKKRAPKKVAAAKEKKAAPKKKAPVKKAPKKKAE